MGNLLGSPVTEKETHRGKTPLGIEYGVSSMQGWRIHMEDAHICLSELYAIECKDDNMSEEDETNGSEKHTCDDNVGKSTENHVAAVVGDTKKNSNNSSSSDSKIKIDNTSLFAVFDGHGGKFAAEYCAEHYVKVLSRNSKFVQYAKDISIAGSDDVEEQKRIVGLLEVALQESFMDLDMELLREAVDGTSNNNDDVSDSGNEEGRSNQQSDEVVMDESGTTIVVVVLTPKFIVCANAGDSRSVYKTSDKACALSFDHKPDDDKEESRIRKAGGYVSGGRVDGDLAVSRGLGDFRFKTSPHLGLERQKVSPVPEFVVKPRNEEKDEFVILACDGIWDVVSNQECIKIVTDIFNEGETDVGLVCEEVLDVCLRLGSKDNMTSLIVKLPALKIGEGGGVDARRQRLKVPDKTSGTPEGDDPIEEEEECEF